jgi:hypothetical protein
MGFIPSFLPDYELATLINAIDRMTTSVSIAFIYGSNLLLTRAFQTDYMALGIRKSPISLCL